MKIKPFRKMWVIIGASLPLIIQTASATVLFSDNFNIGTGGNSDGNRNLNFDLADRQGGTLAPATYDGWSEHYQVGNTGTDVGQPGGYAAYGGGYVLVAYSGSFFSDLDVATISSGPLTFEFDMFQPTGTSSDWAAFSLRFPGDSSPMDQAGEFGFLRRLNGGMQMFQSGTNIAPGSWDTSGFAPATHWKLIFTDTAGTGSAFVGNGSQVTIINGTAWTNTIPLSQLNSKNLRFGWTTSHNSDAFCGIDNLVVSGTPAPASHNLSFEQDAISSGNVAAFTGWHRFIGTDAATAAAVGGWGGDIGSEFPSIHEYPMFNPMANPADGNQYLFVNMSDSTVTGGLYQDMGPMIPNHTYNLTVAIGSRADRLNSPGIISLVNGTNNLGTVLATGGGLPSTQGIWQDFTVTYTTGPSVSGDLTICLSVLGAQTIQANFDNVRLDAPVIASVQSGLLTNTLPKYAETVVGDQVVFTAAFSNSPAVNLQWQAIKSGVTNDVSGATTSTLTLNNVQVSDSGYYLLKAVNATNGLDVAYSTARELVVSNAPAAVNNVIVNYAGQTFDGNNLNFFPAWPVDTNDLNLVAGFASGSGPGTFTFVGDFTGGGNYCNADPTILSDGMTGSMTTLPNLAFCACGTLNSGVGSSITYSLVTASAPYGLDLTNITVFGGWQDAGRDEQKYQVEYSTMQAPGVFTPLLTADYVPTDPDNSPVITRTTLVPASGVMVHNVAAVMINWNLSPSPKNDWEGYSEVLVGGTPSTGYVPSLTNDITPSAAADVVGGQIVLMAGFSGATSLQWKVNGTNIPGATTSTLTLNKLQLTNAGVYTLVASNSIGGNSTSGCTVTVNSAPLPVGNIVTTVALQTSVAQVFTPTWNTNVLSSSLINNVVLPGCSGEGDFTGGNFNIPTGGSGPSVLTDGTFGTIDFSVSGLHTWVTCIGSGTSNNGGPLLGGQYVVYTLPASANGYDITNIMTAGGWNDGGRDQQSYTINYATAANPTDFMPLAVVSYNPTNPVGYSMSRVTLTPVSGVLASNVVALEFDMTWPAGENGYSGYSEMAVYGSPSATPQAVGPVITIAHEETTNNTWTVETPNLIANQLPSSQGPGVFTGEGCSVTNLTDGVLGFGFAYAASCGADTNSSVSWITYNSAHGWDLTNIVVYSMWNDYGRDGQFYNLSYSTWSAPTTFLPLASVAYNPPVPHNGTATGNRVTIAPPVGQTLLASSVAAVKFDFTPQGSVDFGWSGYTEIVLQGTNLTLLPTTAPVINSATVSGGNLIIMGTGGYPANGSYTVVTTTNLSAPIIWTTNSTGILNGGAFTNTIPLDGTTPSRFFRLLIP
jgi:hypothetical protein